MDDVIFSEDSQIFKIQYLRNYAINMHRVNAKKFQKFSPNDLLYKINNDSDFIAPLNQQILETATIQMNFFKKQLLHYRLYSIFVDIRNNAFLLSGPTVRTISTLWLGLLV